MSDERELRVLAAHLRRRSADLTRAKAREREAMAELRTAVRAAADAGMKEREIVRTVSVSRVTVRKMMGKDGA